MGIYLFLAFASLVTYSVTEVNRNSSIAKVLLLFFILVGGLSYTNGWDWYGYSDYYNTIQNDGFSSVKEYNAYGIEYLYLTYMYLIGLTGLGFGFFIFINAILVNVLIYKFCEQARINYGLFMFIFLAVSYLRLELSTIRQGLAVVLVMYSYSLILNSKLKNTLAFILLAICLHRSAAIVLLFMPFILMVNKKIIHYFIVVLAIPFIILSGTMNSLFIQVLTYLNHGVLAAFASKLIIYLSINTTAIVNFQAIALLLLYLFSIYFCDLKDKKQLLFLNVMACQVIISLYFTFVTQLVIMRMVYYFQIGWICWVIILYKEYCRPKWLCISLICMLFLVKAVLNFRYEADRAVFFPYYNVISSFLDDDYGRSREFILDKADEFPQG
ncbi:TPA: EpsG family protein [Citrobacter amalonaticus]